MTPFLAAGDVLINPALLAYAVVDADTEGQQVRLGFSGSTPEEPWELVVRGVEVLRASMAPHACRIPRLRRAFLSAQPSREHPCAALPHSQLTNDPTSSLDFR